MYLIVISLLGFRISDLGSSPCLAQTAFDPLAVGVGARALGMGKAYAAVAEHADTIFTNPAGLGEIDSFEFVSMSATLLEEVSYTILGGVYPLGDRSAVGLGYAAAAVGGIELRDSSGLLSNKTSFHDSVLLLAYGRKLTDQFSLGLNCKFYGRNGYDVSQATAQAMNADLGLLQQGLGWLSFGIVGQNILTGQQMSYGGNYREPLPFSLKLGTRLFILGEDFRSAILFPAELTVAADADLSLRAGTPTTLHLGLELTPVDFLTLRAGFDQDQQGSGVTTNPTCGASLNYAGIGFHFAHHPYGDLPGNTSSFFSLSLNERGWPFHFLPDFLLGGAPSPLQS